MSNITEQELASIIEGLSSYASNIRRWPSLHTEDIMQEAFVRCARKVRKGELAEDTAHNYVIAAMHSYVKDYARQFASRPTEALTVHDKPSRCRTDRLSIHTDEQQFCDYALSLLTPVTRDVVTLRAEGFSYEEISNILGTTPGSVRRQMFNARAILKPYLIETLGLTAAQLAGRTNRHLIVPETPTQRVDTERQYG